MVSTCPKCGRPGSRYLRREGERVYVYFSHYDPETGKRRKCYVGPYGGYKYVENQHTLGLSNLEDTDYYSIATKSLKKYIEKMLKEGEKDPQRLNELYDKLLKLDTRIMMILLELEKRLKGQQSKPSTPRKTPGK